MVDSKNNKIKLEKFVKEFSNILDKYEVDFLIKSSEDIISYIKDFGITSDGSIICLITRDSEGCAHCGEKILHEIENYD